MIESLEYKPDLRAAVRRMKIFWDLKPPEDRIPAVVHLTGRKGGLDGFYFGKTAAYAEDMEEHFKLRSGIADEYMPVVVPRYGHALISALCGAKIVNTGQTVWSAPFIEDLSQANGLRLDWGGEWGRRFIEDYQYLTDRARGKYAVGVYETEGVSDTMSALRGAENVFMDFETEPEKARSFARKVTDVLIEFGAWNNKHIGEDQNILGGMATDWAFWMPEGSCITAEDFSVMCGQDYYRDNFMEHTARLAGAFTNTLIEVHKEGNRHIKLFGGAIGIKMMTLENLRGMETRCRDDVKNLLGIKRFYISADPGHIEETLAFTGLTGVLLVTHANSVGEANKILENVERLTEKFKSKK